MQSLLSLWRSFMRIIASIALIGTMIYLTMNIFGLYKKTIQHQQIMQNNVTDLLLSQTILTAAPLIQEDNVDALYLLSTQVSSEDFVQDITFYNNDGIQIVSNNKAPTSDNTVYNNSDIAPDASDEINLNIKTPLMTTSLKYTQLVRPIILNQTPIGFVRITFEPKQIQAWSNRQYMTNISNIYIALAISFICGGLFVIVIVIPWQRRQKAPLLEKKNSPN